MRVVLSDTRPGAGAVLRLLPLGVGGEDQAGAQDRRHAAGVAGHADDLARHRRLRLHHPGFRRHVLHPGPGLRRALRFMKPSGRLEPPPWMDDTSVRALVRCRSDDADIAARFVGGCVRDAVLQRPMRGRRHRPGRRQAARDDHAGARVGRSIKVGADRPEARHGDGACRRRSVRTHDPASRCRDRRPPRGRGLHRRLAGGRQPARLHLQRALRRSRRHALRSVRRPERSRGGPRTLHRRCRHRASPRTGCGCCASSASTPGTAGCPSTGRASRPAAATPAACAVCRASASRKELLRLLEAPAPADTLQAMRRSRVRSIIGCRNSSASRASGR